MTAPYVMTFIGDSLTFGTGAPELRGFTFHVQQMLQAQYPSVHAYHFGVVGATTLETWRRVRRDEQIRERLAAADLVTLTSGGNDLIQAAKKLYFEGSLRSMKPPMRKFAIAYRALIDELVRINRTLEHDRTIVVTDCYNPFPRVRDAVLWIGYVNRIIERTAEQYRGRVKVAKTYEAFAGKEEMLLADDGIHPNGDGHRVIAEAVAEALASNAFINC